MKQPSARVCRRGIEAALRRGEAREAVLAKLAPWHADAAGVVADIEREMASAK
jgi:hypothetical protein